MRHLIINKDLQEWMFRDFIYSAWAWAKGNIIPNTCFDRIDVDPYKARRLYVPLADKLLKRIPGPHQRVMDSWPPWDASKSPPVLEDTKNRYPNPKWRPIKELSQPKVPAKPKVEVPPSQPALSKSPDGPTLLNQPITDASTKGKLNGRPDINRPQALEAPPQAAINVPAILEVHLNLLPKTNIQMPVSDAPFAPVRSGGLSIHPATRKVVEVLPPMVGGLQGGSNLAAPGDVISVSEESSFDIDAALAGIQGIPDTTEAIGQGVEKSIQSPGEIVNHFAIMGGNH
jgi:hypothetical protein